MSTNIYDSANELGRALTQLPEYIAVKESKAAVEAIPEAKALLDEYTTVNKAIQANMQKGQMPGEKEQADLESLNSRIQEFPELMTYFSRQQALAVYISDMEKIIFSPLEELF